MRGVSETLGSFTLLCAWLLLGTATCCSVARVDVPPEIAIAISAGAGIVGLTWALGRTASWLETLLAFGCVPYFVGIEQWLAPSREPLVAGQPGSFDPILSSWGTALAVASATAALTLAARCLESARRPPG